MTRETTPGRFMLRVCRLGRDPIHVGELVHDHLGSPEWRKHHTRWANTLKGVLDEGIDAQLTWEPITTGKEL